MAHHEVVSWNTRNLYYNLASYTRVQFIHRDISINIQFDAQANFQQNLHMVLSLDMDLRSCLNLTAWLYSFYMIQVFCLFLQYHCWTLYVYSIISDQQANFEQNSHMVTQNIVHHEAPPFSNSMECFQPALPVQWNLEIRVISQSHNSQRGCEGVIWPIL